MKLRLWLLTCLILCLGSASLYGITINATVNPANGGVPLTVQFTCTVTECDTISSYHWTFGDGDTSDEANPTHIYIHAGTYDVSVTVNGIHNGATVSATAEQDDCITVYGMDVCFVIDCSQSMATGNKLTQAKNACDEFIDLLHDGDEAAMVAFSNHIMYASEPNMYPQVSGLTGSIGAIQPCEYTCFGIGAYAGCVKLTHCEDYDPPMAEVFVSDGMQNVAPLFANVIGAIPNQNTVRFYTFGFGNTSLATTNPGAQLASFLQSVASARPGFYTNGTNAAAVNTALENIYTIHAGADRMGMDAGTVAPGASTAYDYLIDASTREVTFNVIWPDTTAILNLHLISPSGEVSLTDSSIEQRRIATQHVLRIPRPTPGTWRVEVQNLSSDTPTAIPVDFNLYATGYTRVNMSYDFDQTDYNLDEPITLQVKLANEQTALANGRVWVDVTTPTNETQTLGCGYDAETQTYSATFYNDSVTGVYMFRFHATGTDATYGAFVREGWLQHYVGAPYDDERALLDAANHSTPTIATGMSISPNPFNPTTTVAYSMPTDGHAQVNVYNIKGQLVKTLVDEQQIAGQHSVTWNGTDRNGRTVASGMYFATFTARTADGKSTTLTRKMVMMK